MRRTRRDCRANGASQPACERSQTTILASRAAIAVLRPSSSHIERLDGRDRAHGSDAEPELAAPPRHPDVHIQASGRQPPPLLIAGFVRAWSKCTGKQAPCSSACRSGRMR